MRRWYFESMHKDLWKLILAPYMLHVANESKDENSVLMFFVVELGLVATRGTLLKNKNVILYRCEEEYDIEKGFRNMAHQRRPDIEDSDPLEVVDRGSSQFLKSLSNYLRLFSKWSLYRTSCTIYGPVSYRHMQKDDRRVVIFGDVHDNLAVPGAYSVEQVNDQFSAFFGASSDFFSPSDVSFERFKFMVQKMKLLPYETQTRFPKQHHLTLFVWEFLVLMLHDLATDAKTQQDATTTAVDVLVEDMLDLPWGERPITTYLGAVKYLFSICPFVRTPDSPFAPFAAHCRDLFPNLKYHRIDLRYGLTDDAVGMFTDDEPDMVLKTIAELLDVKGENMDLATFAQIVQRNHHTTSRKDEEMLYDEFVLAKNAMQKIPALLAQSDNRVSFFATFLHSVKTYYKFPTSRSRWFLFRTCLTDLYGFARLLASPNKRAFVYVGDYHARVWANLLESYAQFALIAKQRSRKQRTLHFPVFSPKPLTDDTLWQHDPEDINEAMSKYVADDSASTSSAAKTSMILQMFTLLDTESLQRICVPLLATELTQFSIDAIEEKYPLSLQDAALSDALVLKDVRIQTKIRCGKDEDGLLNSFDNMNLDQISAVYEQEGDRKQCYAAPEMYKWWQACFKDGRAFRDPLTRSLISRHEQSQILKLTPNATRPIRRRNSAAWKVVFGTIMTFQEETVGESTIGERTEENAKYVQITPDAVGNLSDEEKKWLQQQDIVTLYTVHLQVPDVAAGPGFHVTYFMCYVGCSSHEWNVFFKPAFIEFVQHSHKFLFFPHRALRHSAIHLGKMQNLDYWMHDDLAETTRQQLKEELTPFVSL